MQNVVLIPVGMIGDEEEEEEEERRREIKKPFPVKKTSPVLIIVGGEWLRLDVNERSLYVNEWIWVLP